MSSMANCEEPRSHKNFELVLKKLHLIREIVARREVIVCKVHTMKI